MKRRNLLLCTVLLTLPPLYAANLPKLSIDELMARVDSFYDNARDQQYSMKMILVEPDGARKERRLSYRAKGEDLAITRFHYPDSVDGMGFLQEENDNFHVYLPDFQKVRKVAAHTKKQSFMGSDFSYNDMNNRRYTRDYEAKLLDDSGDRYLVELTPKPDTNIEYARLVLTVVPGTWVIETIDYYAQDGEQVKRQTRDDLVEVQGILIQRRVTMEDLKSGHKTILQMSDIVFNQGLDDDVFSVRNLRRIR